MLKRLVGLLIAVLAVSALAQLPHLNVDEFAQGSPQSFRLYSFYERSEGISELRGCGPWRIREDEGRGDERQRGIDVESYNSTAASSMQFVPDWECVGINYVYTPRNGRTACETGGQGPCSLIIDPEATADSHRVARLYVVPEGIRTGNGGIDAWIIGARKPITLAEIYDYTGVFLQQILYEFCPNGACSGIDVRSAAPQPVIGMNDGEDIYIKSM